MPQTVKIKFQNGINCTIALRDILNELTGDFIFEESDQPDFILFGPYGNDIPAPGAYTRIGYFCENIKPDMSICEWAFGVPPEQEVNNPRYKRIQWHGIDPLALIKPADYDAVKILKQKKYFCNFLYSHKVPYREEFFRQLSKYKKVNAPGKSMNNMQSIDKNYSGDFWHRKKQFLSEYKFTIAFENYVYPGYQTEKLYDAMQANSMPVYCGDQSINAIFNTKSFINAADYFKTDSTATKWLEKHSQMDFMDIRPQFYHNPIHRLKRKLRAAGRSLKMNLQFGNLNFGPLIERIIELDQDDNKYLEVLQQPWFIKNQPPINASNSRRWAEIFNSKSQGV
jgi:hypothetical protein